MSVLGGGVGGSSRRHIGMWCFLGKVGGLCWPSAGPGPGAEMLSRVRGPAWLAHRRSGPEFFPAVMLTSSYLDSTLIDPSPMHTPGHAPQSFASWRTGFESRFPQLVSCVISALRRPLWASFSSSVMWQRQRTQLLSRWL